LRLFTGLRWWWQPRSHPCLLATRAQGPTPAKRPA
jgi:hypothetical protein